MWSAKCLPNGKSLKSVSAKRECGVLVILMSSVSVMAIGISLRKWQGTDFFVPCIILCVNSHKTAINYLMTAKEVLLKWIDAFNRANVESLSALYSDDAVNHQVANE